MATGALTHPSDARRQTHVTSRQGSDAEEVVACVLRHGGRLALLRRSAAVGHDRGKWHCVTGFVPAGTQPLHQALTEVEEETRLTPDRISVVRRGEPFRRDVQHTSWIVHPFLIDVASDALSLNWENSAYQWVPCTDSLRLDSVTWLPDVLEALDLPTTLTVIAREDAKADWPLGIHDEPAPGEGSRKVLR